MGLGKILLMAQRAHLIHYQALRLFVPHSVTSLSRSKVGGWKEKRRTPLCLGVPQQPKGECVGCINNRDGRWGRGCPSL